MTRRTLVGGVTLTAVTALTAFAGAQGARASEPYEKATKLKCEDCHEHTKEQFEAKKLTGFEATQDLKKKCGKESFEFLKKQAGFKALQKGEKRSPEDAKKWASVLFRARWKCAP